MQALWAVMLDQLHPTISDSARGAFGEDRYGTGVLEALKACEREFRARVEAEGRRPMPETVTKCLDTERRGGTGPWVEEDHLKAFRMLCIGAFGACRNPLAHNQLAMDASQAFAWLGVVHLMLTLMDAPELPPVDPAADLP